MTSIPPPVPPGTVNTTTPPANPPHPVVTPAAAGAASSSSTSAAAPPPPHALLDLFARAKQALAAFPHQSTGVAVATAYSNATSSSQAPQQAGHIPISSNSSSNNSDSAGLLTEPQRARKRKPPTETDDDTVSNKAPRSSPHNQAGECLSITTALNASTTPSSGSSSSSAAAAAAVALPPSVTPASAASSSAAAAAAFAAQSLTGPTTSHAHLGITPTLLEGLSAPNPPPPGLKNTLIALPLTRLAPPFQQAANTPIQLPTSLTLPSGYSTSSSQAPSQAHRLLASQQNGHALVPGSSSSNTSASNMPAPAACSLFQQACNRSDGFVLEELIELFKEQPTFVFFSNDTKRLEDLLAMRFSSRCNEGNKNNIIVIQSQGENPSYYTVLRKDVAEVLKQGFHIFSLKSLIQTAVNASRAGSSSSSAAVAAAASSSSSSASLPAAYAVRPQKRHPLPQYPIKRLRQELAAATAIPPPTLPRQQTSQHPRLAPPTPSSSASHSSAAAAASTPSATSANARLATAASNQVLTVLTSNQQSTTTPASSSGPSSSSSPAAAAFVARPLPSYPIEQLQQELAATSPNSSTEIPVPATEAEIAAFIGSQPLNNKHLVSEAISIIKTYGNTIDVTCSNIERILRAKFEQPCKPEERDRLMQICLVSQGARRSSKKSKRQIKTIPLQDVPEHLNRGCELYFSKELFHEIITTLNCGFGRPSSSAASSVSLSAPSAMPPPALPRQRTSQHPRLALPASSSSSSSSNSPKVTAEAAASSMILLALSRQRTSPSSGSSSSSAAAAAASAMPPPALPRQQSSQHPRLPPPAPSSGSSSSSAAAAAAAANATRPSSKRPRALPVLTSIKVQGKTVSGQDTLDQCFQGIPQLDSL